MEDEANSFWIVFWIKPSVSTSTLAVASSRTRIRHEFQRWVEVYSVHFQIIFNGKNNEEKTHGYNESIVNIWPHYCQNHWNWLASLELLFGFLTTLLQTCRDAEIWETLLVDKIAVYGIVFNNICSLVKVKAFLSYYFFLKNNIMSDITLYDMPVTSTVRSILSPTTTTLWLTWLFSLQWH